MPLSARELAFLHESNRIEDIDRIDYAIPALQTLARGHVGALRQTSTLARRSQVIGVAELEQWQQWITVEQREFGYPIPAAGIGVLRGAAAPFDVRIGNHVAPPHPEVAGLIRSWISDLQEALTTAARPTSDVTAAELLGSFFQRFEAIHPFVDGNGRTGRLVANFIAQWCGLPLLVFRIAERSDYYAAHRSKAAMRCFMADKLREAILWDGELIEREREYESADVYKRGDGGTLVVERHELVAARAEWAKEAG